MRFTVPRSWMIGDTEFVLKFLQQTKDLFAHQLIERGGHFVADDEIRFGRERPGDPHALFLAPDNSLVLRVMRISGRSICPSNCATRSRTSRPDRSK